MGGATVVNFEIELSDVDRGVYETLSLKAAQHPSETPGYLVARVLAFALEHTEGIAFTNGLFSGDEPALWVHDLTGHLTAWIEVGDPTAERLHKASKSADRVAVYCHKDPSPWLRNLVGSRVHQSRYIQLYALPVDAVGALAAGLKRRNQWSLSRVDGVIYVETETEAVTLTLTALAWPSG